MEIKALIHRLRRVASGEDILDVYRKFGGNVADNHTADCRAWANACFDQTPITEEWLAELGFEQVESDMGPDYENHWQIGDDEGTNIWRFNETPEWIVSMFDQYRAASHSSIYTRGQLIQLLSALGVWDGE